MLFFAAFEPRLSSCPRATNTTYLLKERAEEKLAASLLQRVVTEDLVVTVTGHVSMIDIAPDSITHSLPVAPGESVYDFDRDTARTFTREGRESVDLSCGQPVSWEGEIHTVYPQGQLDTLLSVPSLVRPSECSSGMNMISYPFSRRNADKFPLLFTLLL